MVATPLTTLVENECKGQVLAVDAAHRGAKLLGTLWARHLLVEAERNNDRAGRLEALRNQSLDRGPAYRGQITRVRKLLRRPQYRNDTTLVVRAAAAPDKFT